MLPFETRRVFKAWWDKNTEGNRNPSLYAQHITKDQYKEICSLFGLDWKDIENSGLLELDVDWDGRWPKNLLMSKVDFKKEKERILSILEKEYDEEE